MFTLLQLTCPLLARCRRPAVTKQIVEQHGGTISVHSKGEGEGSVFTVRLPCFLGDDHDADEELFDMEQEPNRRKLSETKTSRLLRSSFVNAFNNIEPRGSHGAGTDSSNTSPPQERQPFHVRMNAVADSVLEIHPVSSLRVLVVDDSDMSRKMVCKVLNATREFHCEQAVDGSVAVDMVRNQLCRSSINACPTVTNAVEEDGSLLQASNSDVDYSFDVILMDYQMPNMDGPTAIAVLRQLGYDGIILGLTGNALLGDRDVMLKAGADGVLVKPMNIDLFRETLKTLSAKY